MLNKAMKLMNKQAAERTSQASKCYDVIREAQEALQVLGFEAIQDNCDVFETNEVNVTPIVINKGQIVEVQTIKEVVIDNTDEIIALENEITFKDGQILGLNKQIKELEDKVAELQEALNAKKLTKKEKVQKMFDSVEDIDDIEVDEPKEEPKPNKGGGAAVNPMLAMLEQIKQAEEQKRKVAEMTSEELVADAIRIAEEKKVKEAEEKEAQRKELPEYSLDYTELTYNKDIQAATLYGIQGEIKLRGKSYVFKATNEHNLPYVPGCTNMDDLLAIKEILSLEVDRFKFTDDNQVKVSYDYMNGELPIGGLYRTINKGQIEYHAYSDKYVLVWCPASHKYPMRKMAKNYLVEGPNLFKAIEQQKNSKKLSDKFMAICESVWPEDFTKAFKLTKESNDTTNDEIKITNERSLADEVADLDL